MELFSSWTGSDFLFFYTALLALGAVAAWWIPVTLRATGRRANALDAEDFAVLVGGRERFADSVLADLYVRGALSEAGSGKLAVVQPSIPASPAGRELLAHAALLSVNEARQMLAAHAERVAARLRRGGLLLRPEELSRLRWLSIAPFAALLLFGLYRQRAGSALGEPTGFLVILLVLTGALAVWRFLKADPRTRAGLAVIAEERARAARLTRAPQPEEVRLAVALFGTGVLVGTRWEPVHALRQHGGSADGGGDSSEACADAGGGCGD
jgi:uncharacterized protein (TIGR04222 family)